MLDADDPWFEEAWVDCEADAVGVTLTGLAAALLALVVGATAAVAAVLVDAAGVALVELDPAVEELVVEAAELLADGVADDEVVVEETGVAVDDVELDVEVALPLLLDEVAV